jgi:hypothetical protein
MLSRALDGQLKSRSFLLSMRYSIDMMTALRRLQGAPRPPSASMRQL